MSIRRVLRAAGGTALVLGSLSAALGQDADTDDLSAKATDPTAALMSFQLNDWYSPELYGRDGSSNQLVLRAAIPFSAGGLQHIFRVTQPYATSGPGGSGVVDTTIFDLVVFGAPWGRWGVGVSGTLPTGGSGLTTDKWTAGPALGFVNSASKLYNWGLFTQTFFSFAGKDSAADVGLINVQPIFAYQLGGGRSLSLGNSAFVYDTERSRWSSQQLGVNYGQVMKFGGYSWRPNIEADYELKDDPGNPKWTIRLGVTLLLPAQ